MSLGLRPAWLEELLVIWATNDMRRAVRKPNRGTVSPMFAMLGAAEPDDAEGTGSLEVAALSKALDVLRSEREECWDAVVRAFRPWAMGPPGRRDHMELLMVASTRLAELVDKEMGDG